MSPMISLRALVLRNAAILFALVLVAGLVLTALSGGWESITQPGWALALAAGIAAFTGWQATQKAKKGLVGGILTDFRLVALDREEWPGADWQAIDRQEVERGKAAGRPRLKFTRIDEMLEALQ